MCKGTRIVTAEEIRKIFGYGRVLVPPPASEPERVFPPDLLQALADGQDPEEVLLEFERRGWRQVKHLFVVK